MPANAACPWNRFGPDRLAVLPMEVVNAADRGLRSERAVRSRRVVVVEPVWQGGGAFVVGAVEEAVRPFARHRLVEALHFPVGAWPVGLGGQVPELAGGEEAAGRAAFAVDPGG